MKLSAWIIRRVTRRAPDFVIGRHEAPYLMRWWILPRNPFFNIYLHRILRSDDDRALHSHPWLFNVSWMLEGGYWEWTPKNYAVRCQAPAMKFRWGAAFHRLELDGEPCWTIFITGPRVREWGFSCPHGFVHWKRFTESSNPGEIGRGCDE